MDADNIKIIKRYFSKLDSQIVLATMSTQAGKYFAEVLGEKTFEFANEVEAITYIDHALENFYISKN